MGVRVEVRSPDAKKIILQPVHVHKSVSHSNFEIDLNIVNIIILLSLFSAKRYFIYPAISIKCHIRKL